MTNTQKDIIQKIRSSYQEREIDKFEQLRNLDKRVKRPAKIFAYVFGSLSSLVLGTGMCLAMKVIGSSIALGICVGLVGIGLTLLTYPIYKKILKIRKKEHSQEIFKLSDALLNN